MRSVFRFFCPAVLAFLSTINSSVFSEELTATSERTPPQSVCFSSTCNASARLLDVERRTMPSTVVSGPNSQASLPEYYWSENRDLLARFADAKQQFQKSPQASFHGVTLVSGAAGVGKTFLKGEVYSKDFPKSTICKFDMAELYVEWMAKGLVAEQADLASGEFELNRLKTVKDKSRPLVREYMDAQEASFFVIDSLDEIHPDDCDWVLEQVEDFAFHRHRPFVHVAVFGRGPAFREFWQRRSEHRDQTDTKLFLLNPPVFRTTGDLLVSSWNYHTWRYGLKWSPNGGEAEAMSLQDYAAWADSGFSREGRFQSVTCEANQDMRPDVQARLLTCARNYPVVCATLYNLAGNSLIREILQADVLGQQPYREDRVMRSYFAGWLVRETGAHGLPSNENSANLDLYLHLLEQIAVKYVQEGRVDGQGFFPVADSDRIRVPQNGRELSFEVKRVLDRSGVMFSDPREQGQLGVTQYRFEPIWIHRMLVEMHNQRVAGIQPGLVVGMASP